MLNPLHPQERRNSTNMDKEALQVIYENIDDHLAFWNILYNDPVPSQEDGLPVSLVQLTAVSDWLKMSSAPLYPSQGVGGVRGFVYRFLNLVVKIFGTPQVRFNQNLRELLGELLVSLQGFNTRVMPIKSIAENQDARIRALEAENYDCLQDVETLTRQIAQLRADLDRLMDEHSGENRT
jgi:hypothetical protein